MSAPLTHVTEWGLVLLAAQQFSAPGLRSMVVACDGSDAESFDVVLGLIGVRDDVILSQAAPYKVPTCPRCAVLRDAALEGKLPEGKL